MDRGMRGVSSACGEVMRDVGKCVRRYGEH